MKLLNDRSRLFEHAQSAEIKMIDDSYMRTTPSARTLQNKAEKVALGTW